MMCCHTRGLCLVVPTAKTLPRTSQSIFINPSCLIYDCVTWKFCSLASAIFVATPPKERKRCGYGDLLCCTSAKKAAAAFFLSMDNNGILQSLNSQKGQKEVIKSQRSVPKVSTAASFSCLKGNSTVDYRHVPPQICLQNVSRENKGDVDMLVTIFVTLVNLVCPL